MGIVLLLLSLAALLGAGAMLLLGSAQRRARAQATLGHAEQRLQRSAVSMAATTAAPAAAAATPAGAASADGKATAGGRPALPWDAALLRAGMTPGWRAPLLALVPGLALAGFAAMRLGTGWAFPLTLLLYALVAWLLLQRRIGRLQQKLIRQLPDFLDNLVRLTALGNSLQMSFQTASTQTVAPLRDLLDTTLRNARGGMDLDRALAQAAAPWRVEALEVLAVVLGVCVRIGGRSDQVLQRLSDFMRDLDQAQQELKATTSETRMSAWVLALLPPISALLMALVSPGFFEPMLREPQGHKILLAALGLELVGGFLLYRLAKSL
ncbi:pilus assembly protein [Stenotrophomonas chelatiphaga]|uniref:Pilus assembly protein n=1 Tax=Stenotrophomonas chelatiphaga TaxID=517011 RepID=A0A0R0D7J5_9GAMM|nr:type II secretion system F family protein [Stenotrophomonas chelatiphaga]KRG73427.1 pilus assembly protein [Stenotrophomonas chelatiphaga]MCS4229548.1 tight adherence protein B [Stenotrophomonas chelatiphaga]ROQ46003.1 tight adherence protein B [Stenotrophomonas maltophilia]